ncbi:MAG: sel1 repeat family protein [Rhodospirillaceae bacterium]|nr:sel1 repeat family protein [Rhodospirillaceae bacterium]
MRKLTTSFLVTFAILLGSAGESLSADFKKGVTAYKNGDYVTALHELEPLAKQGDAGASTILGGMFTFGKGVPQNYKIAVRYYLVAANQGIAFAQYSLGNMYSNGEGVPQDYETAVKWHTFAANQGHARAQTNLGVMYSLGRGVKKDNVYAYKWGCLGALNGNINGAKLSDFVSNSMTSSQLSRAKRLCLNFVPAPPPTDRNRQAPPPLLIKKKPKSNNPQFMKAKLDKESKEAAFKLGLSNFAWEPIECAAFYAIGAEGFNRAGQKKNAKRMKSLHEELLGFARSLIPPKTVLARLKLVMTKQIDEVDGDYRNIRNKFLIICPDEMRRGTRTEYIYPNDFSQAAHMRKQ